MLDLLAKRRSIRKFKPQALDDTCIAKLKEAVLRAPTSKNRQPWQFVFVTEPATLEQLALCKPHGAAFLKTAPLAVVVLADPKQSDVWIEDSAIAAITLQYTAQSLHLGNCWVQVRCRFTDNGQPAANFVKEVIDAPAHLEVLSIIGIGVPAEEKPGVPKERLAFDQTMDSRFNKPARSK